jgi:hypothetical protein
MVNEKQEREHDADERQRRILRATGDFLKRTTRGQRPGRPRPAERADGLFDGTNHRTGMEQ